MAETTTNPANEWDEMPEGILEIHRDNVHLEGDAIEKLATLGAQASGVDIRFVTTAEGHDGLPSFPIAIIHGEQPKIGSVKALAEEWRRFPEHRRGVAVVAMSPA